MLARAVLAGQAATVATINKDISSIFAAYIWNLSIEKEDYNKIT